MLYFLDWNLCFNKGVKVLSKVTNIAGIAKILMGILFIILAFVFVFFMKNPPAQEFTVETLTPKFDWTFLWLWHGYFNHSEDLKAQEFMLKIQKEE